MGRADNCQPRGCACRPFLQRVGAGSCMSLLVKLISLVVLLLSVASHPLRCSLLHVCNRESASRDMDPLSVTASIIAILQLSAEVLTYLNNVKEALKDRAQCAIEASSLYNFLVNLRFRLEEGDVSQPWYTTV